MKILYAGDCAVTVECGDKISPRVNGLVLALEAALQAARIQGITETVPAYRSLLVYYDPCVIGYSQIERQIRQLSENLNAAQAASGRVVRIPVCYGGAYGKDLADVAKHTGLKAEDVVRLHSAETYLIYMLGFLPGFAYLGGMNPKLATPRLDTPRKTIPAGSVAIGGQQTGVYPMPSPGGWRLIGRTPVRPYDPRRAEPFLYRAGDSIVFEPVSEEEFERISTQVERGSFACAVEGGRADGH